MYLILVCIAVLLSLCSAGIGCFLAARLLAGGLPGMGEGGGQLGQLHAAQLSRPAQQLVCLAKVGHCLHQGRGCESCDLPIQTWCLQRTGDMSAEGAGLQQSSALPHAPGPNRPRRPT